MKILVSIASMPRKQSQKKKDFQCPARKCDLPLPGGKGCGYLERHEG
jgi:hypothetical protein